MPDSQLCLEALSVLSGCNVEQTSGASQLTPQDFVNIVALKEFYKQEGFKELQYPSLGTVSLQDLDDQDMYSSPQALNEGPSTAGPEHNLRTRVKINPQDFFHPQYDFDFTNVKDGNTKFFRGNEQYLRPCGWNRVALRVLQRYDGGDHWLGKGKDAWPVSYHGHNMDGSLGIILTHGGSPVDEPDFLDVAAASLVSRETRGRGVYSTCNPDKRKKCQRKDIWLVYVPEGSSGAQTRAIVQESIRPYGLLLLQV